MSYDNIKIENLFGDVYLKVNPDSDNYFYDGLIDFHMVIKKDNQNTYTYDFNMANSLDVLENKSKIPNEKLEKNYIKLSDFLKNAKYIGQFGYRSNNPEYEDDFYTDEECLFLFVGDTHALYLSEDENGEEVFDIMDKRLINSGLEFSGDVNNSYNNPEKIENIIKRHGIVSFRKAFDRNEGLGKTK